MSLQDVMQAIEGHQFAAEMNLASGSLIFHRALQNHRLFRELSEHANEPGARDVILARVVELSREQIEPQYENPFDTAMTAYLTVLDLVANPEILANAVEAASKAPNCWWAAEASMRLLSKVKLLRLRQMVSLGQFEPVLRLQAPTGLGHMTGLKPSCPSLALAPARIARFSTRRRAKRARGVDGDQRRPKQLVWSQQQLA